MAVQGHAGGLELPFGIVASIFMESLISAVFFLAVLELLPSLRAPVLPGAHQEQPALLGIAQVGSPVCTAHPG